MGASAPSPNPKRVAAGRLNRTKRKGLTPEGRERLRQAALARRPWEFATGPTSADGKATSAGNGRWRQDGPVSLRAVRRELSVVAGLTVSMTRVRAAVPGE